MKPMVTDVYPMGTDVYLMVTDGSRGIQCCQPLKSCKNWWKYQKNGKRWVGNTAFANELPDSLVVLVPLTDYRVTSMASVWYPIYCRSPTAKLASVTQWHRQPTEKSESSRIVIGCHRSPNIPGLVSMYLRINVMSSNQVLSFTPQAMLQN